MKTKQKIQIAFCVFALTTSAVFLSGNAPKFVTEDIPNAFSSGGLFEWQGFGPLFKYQIPQFFTKITPDSMARKGDLKGQVFIATKGGANVPLGAVEVDLYDYEEIRKEVPRNVEAGGSSEIFSRLPDPLKSTQTDADGRFSFNVRRDSKYVVCTSGSRKVWDETERYYWLVEGSLGGEKSKVLILSNGNLTTAMSQDSLLFDSAEYQ